MVVVGVDDDSLQANLQTCLICFIKSYSMPESGVKNVVLYHDQNS